jgi:hypothetical protein
VAQARGQSKPMKATRKPRTTPARKKVGCASWLQVLTRDFATPLVVSDALIKAIELSAANSAARLLESLEDRGEQALRGRSAAVRVWTRTATR